MSFRLHTLVTALALALWPLVCAAEPQQFDLVGPTLAVSVSHGAKTLPIAEAPNLSPGDQVSIRLERGGGEAVRYLLVAAFLRGATNPPPQSWFHRSETWGRSGKEGMKITVPGDAQQLVVFLAPDVNGDYKTLMDAVRGRPGAFVRASQDLNQASLDRSRLEAFLASIRRNNEVDPDHLKAVAPLLARSLTLKLDPACLQRPAELQAPCLLQGQNALVLNDGQSSSLVQALTSGDSANLIQQLSASPQAGAGYYSPYVGAVLDIARILGSFHSAQYQYIPALTVVRGAEASLLLNTAPSFHSPMSVLVAALPAVAAPQTPPLQPVDPKSVFCAQKPELILPVQGAPLAFSTAFAHDLVLRLKGADGAPLDLPVRADAEQGGFIVDTSSLASRPAAEGADGVLHGDWGFTAFDGPEFRLQIAPAKSWRLESGDRASLTVGREESVELQAEASACVKGVSLKIGAGDPRPVDWRSDKPGEIIAALPLKDVAPGPLSVLVQQYGAASPAEVDVKAYAQTGRLDSFDLHADDGYGVLKGARLDQVSELQAAGVTFKPGERTTTHGSDELVVSAADPSKILGLIPGRKLAVKVMMSDGRVARLESVVAPPRPRVVLIDRSQTPTASAGRAQVQLADHSEVVGGAVLTFSLRAASPPEFGQDLKVEVATADGAYTTLLTSPGALVLADPKVALATLDTAKAFDGSAYGLLRFRVLSEGAVSDWQPLATLVRLPDLKELRCAAHSDSPCQLKGSNLFLLHSVSSDARFEDAIKVPEGFAGSTLQVPRPRGGRLYLRLHDDPAATDVAVFSGQETGRGALPLETRTARMAAIVSAPLVGPPPDDLRLLPALAPAGRPPT